MILSVHVPKTAGTTFGAMLRQALGPRVLEDYGDWVEIDDGPARLRRAQRWQAAHAQRSAIERDYAAIHGHYAADKYRGMFATARIVAFFRDPYQQAVSGYESVKRRPDIDHPVVTILHGQSLNLVETIARFPNIQSAYLATCPLEELAVVGLTEQFERSISLAERVLGLRLPPARANRNVNSRRPAGGYLIDGDIRRAVDRHRGEDVELYRKACERFERVATIYGL